MSEIEQKAHEAQLASLKLATASTEEKNNALKAIADAIEKEKITIQEANNKDLEAAEKDNISDVLKKRLKFDGEKIDEVIQGIQGMIKLEDPVGAIQKQTELDTGLILTREACPLGVIGIVFESRPDALVQISALCLKSGNAVLLKGGSEARHTNAALFDIIRSTTEHLGIAQGWIQLLESREDVKEMLNQDKYLNLIIPRGSNAFVQHVMNNTKIPVLGHADGICHTYIDEDADIDMAVKVAFDAKCQYPAVCNATETILVHEKVAKEVLPLLHATLGQASVVFKGDEASKEIIEIEAATDKDWDTEYNDFIVSIKVVVSMDEAIDFINTHGSKHTDAIVTKNKEAAESFMHRVDAANVFWNASTRFADGFRYGLGAEVGVSTSKIHARGPVGLEGLIIYKYKLQGDGHIVADYSGNDPKRTYTHKPLK